MTPYIKFRVERLEGTPSGNYAVATNINGNETYYKNYGYKVNDLVEMWGYDGYAPKRIDVNGVNIWSESDRQNYWKRNDPNNTDRQTLITKQHNYA